MGTREIDGGEDMAAIGVQAYEQPNMESVAFICESPTNFHISHMSDATAMVQERLTTVVAAFPLRRCLLAIGRAPPQIRATMSEDPRLLVVVSGQGRMALPCGAAVVEVDLRAGDAVAVAAHAWNRPLPGGLAFLVIFVGNDHLRFVSWQQAGGAMPRQPTCRCAIDGVPPALLHTLQAVMALGPGPEAEACRRALFEVVVREAGRHFASGGSDSSPTRLLWQAIGDWMDEHLHIAIDRRAASALFHVHPNHISRLFREQGGEGFAAALIRRRLERADRLLRSSDLPVAEVGRRCGYPDPAAFASAFRRWSGVSPRARRA